MDITMIGNRLNDMPRHPGQRALPRRAREWSLAVRGIGDIYIYIYIYTYTMYIYIDICTYV